MTSDNEKTNGPVGEQSPVRERLLTVATLLIPVLFFVLLEGGLRLVGYGHTYPLFEPVQGHPAYLHQNRDVARRYFSQIREVPSSQQDFFKAKKDSGTFRLFVQGGSTAAGFPFYYGGSFSRMLEQRLLQTFPGKNVEVVNTAMAAVNSYTLLDFADEIIAQQPDLVIVYAGHNEYYGALGVGSTETMGPTRFLVNTYLRLRGLRTVQLVQEAVTGVADLVLGRGTPGKAPGRTLMSRMAREQSIPYESDLYQAGLIQFRENLSDLLARYEEAGIPVLIGTLASNERGQRPFVSRLAPSTDSVRFHQRLRAGRKEARRGDTTAALSDVNAALRLDSLSADAFFEKGRLEEAADSVEARHAYLAAKDRDQLRFRAPEVFNRIIREEARAHGAVVVETQEKLADASEGGIIGDKMILEHLHPTVSGYFQLADAFYDALHREGRIGKWTRPVPDGRARRELLLTPVDSIVGRLRVKQLMGSWPYQPPGVTRSLLSEWQPRNRAEEISLKVVQDELDRGTGIRRLQRYYARQGNYHRALQSALALIQEYPFLSGPYLRAANLLLRQKRYKQALTYFRAANERKPSAPAQRMIGTILLKRGKPEKAVHWLRHSLKSTPHNVQALYNLGGAYAQLHHYAKARRIIRRLLQSSPNHRGAQRLLESLPN